MHIKLVAVTMEIAWNHGSEELMEDKQLNFNQPLLSVRRFSQTVASEREDKRKTENSLRGILRLPHYKSELKSGPVSNAGAVPFVWEQKPGRPKEDIKPQTQNSERPPIAPMLPPGRSPKASKQDSDEVSATTNVTKSQLRNVTHDVQSVPSVLDKNKNFDNFKEIKEDKDSSDSGDSEEAYVDALDTLSRTESFFVNCSVSGLSGFDDLDMKPSGRFSTDPQMQEFMMGRFLPAAKAMASETHEYVPKKQPVVREQQRQIKKKVTGDKPLLRYGPSFANLYSHQYHDNDGDYDNEESDDDSCQGGNLLAVCGLLPRFCYKSSLCLLNPVPAMSVRTRVPRSSANKMQGRSPSPGSFSATENESSSDTSLRKSAGEVQTDEAVEDKTCSRNQFNSNNWQRQNLKGSPLCRPLDGHITTIYCDESPQFIHEEKGVLVVPEETEGYKTFEELLSDQSSSKEIDSTSPVEKTLYIDTIQQVESPRMRFCLSHKQVERIPDSGDKDYEVIAKSNDQHNLHTADEGAKLLPSAQKSSDFIVVSSINKSNIKDGMGVIKAFGHEHDVYRNSANYIEVNEKKTTESLRQQPQESENLESHQSHFQFPLPPPLPKSPSDSWLFRTLPSMSTKNSFLHSYLGTATNPQNQGLKAQTCDPKWETMVKTTKEQLTPIPET